MGKTTGRGKPLAPPNLSQALNAGLLSNALTQPANQRRSQIIGNTPTQSASDLNGVPETARLRPPMWRRIGGKALRSLKPLLDPLLHRFEWRIRTAVEKTTVGSNADEITRVLHKLETLSASTQQLLDRLDARVTELQTTHVKFDKLMEVATANKTSIDRLVIREALPLGLDKILVRNGYGFLLLPSEDTALVSYFGQEILPEPGTIRMFEKLLRAGMTVLDIGANVGAFTLIAARLVGPAGRVIAIEPTPQLDSLLRQMAFINGIESWTEIYQAAAGQEMQRATLHLGVTSGHNSLYKLPAQRGEVEVDIVPVDTLIEPGRRIDLCKIDAEGAELSVLRGMKRVIAENPEMAIILEYGPSHLKRVGMSSADWFASLYETGMQIWEIDEETGKLRNLPRSGIEELASINLLLKRDIGKLGPLLTECSAGRSRSP